MEPNILPVRVVCPQCRERLCEAVVTPFSQMHGPMCKTLREAYQAHVVAVVHAGSGDGPRRCLMTCPLSVGGAVPVEGTDYALGRREATAYDARASVAPVSTAKPVRR